MFRRSCRYPGAVQRIQGVRDALILEPCENSSMDPVGSAVVHVLDHSPKGQLECLSINKIRT